MKNTVVKSSLLVLIVFLGIITDLYTKNWAKNSLQNKTPKTIISGFVECGYAENRGMVFGILNRAKPGIIHHILRHTTVIGAVILLGFMLFHRKQRFFYLLPFGIILSGAIGNAIDKIMYGFVIDFIHIHFLNILDWPFYFNFADAWICIGMVIILIQMIFMPSLLNTEHIPHKK